MRRTTTLALSAVYVTLYAMPSSAQIGGQPGQLPPTDRREPGQFGGFQGQPGMGELPLLAARHLEDRPLEGRQQKRYENAIKALRRRIETASGNAVQEAANTFRLGSTHLEYGQEVQAAEAFSDAWKRVIDLASEPQTVAAGLAQARSHLRQLQAIAPKDAPLAVALLADASPAHEAAYETIEDTRTKEQLARLLAGAWAPLMQIGQLDQVSMASAVRWVMMFPELALTDRRLNELQAAEYQSQLTKVNIEINQRLRELAERQLAAAAGRPMPRPRPTPGGNLPGAAPDTADPMTLRMINELDAKRGPIALFMEAEVHFRWGQMQRGMAATAGAWRELLGFYRSNPRNISPADTDPHFAAVQQLVRTNPVQAAFVLDRMDGPYRTMAQIDPHFSIVVAEEWDRLTSAVPLTAGLLTRAVLWVEAAGKLSPNLAARYEQSLDRIKADLENARQAEGLAGDQQGEEATGDDGDNNDGNDGGNNDGDKENDKHNDKDDDNRR